MEPLAQFVHPSVQLSLLITYLQKSCSRHIDSLIFILFANQIGQMYRRSLFFIISPKEMFYVLFLFNEHLINTKINNKQLC